MLWTQIVVYITVYFGLFTSVFFLLILLDRRKEINDPGIKKFPFVSIIINVWNEEKVIHNVIKSVLDLNYPKDKYEIIVVDDGSTDRTYERAKVFCNKGLPFVRVLKKKNGGAASAKNYGIKYARGEIVTTLDADSFVCRDALKKMLGYFDDNDIYAVTAALTVHDPKGFWQNVQLIEYTLGIFLRKVFSLADAIHVIPGPFSLYRKKLFDKIGYFEENNITEDTEIAMRTQSYGYKIKNCMSANVYTIAPDNFKALMKQRIRWYYGFMYNSFKYRNLFNPIERRDNLAVLLLPAAFVSVFLTIASLFVFFYQNYVYFKDSIARVMVLGYNIIPQVSDISSVNLNYVKDVIVSYVINPFTLFIILGLFTTLFFVFLAKKLSQDKRSYVFALFCFFLTYWFFYALWWISAFTYRIVLRKKIKWGPRYY